MEQLSKAIIQTLVYADIFDYPLNSEELHKFLINSSIRHSEEAEGRLQNPVRQAQGKSDSGRASLARMTEEEMLKLIQHDKNGPINSNGKFFFLKGREEIVNLRKKREKWSQEKLKIAETVGKKLRMIPWIKMVGITGSLALLNSDKDDDIDILIISARNRLWLTRLWATVLLELTGQRRRPPENKPETKSGNCPNLSRVKSGEKISDKICLNMFLDDDHLGVPEKERDLYAAHEVCQMKCLWDRGECYRKFLQENQWVRKYLPNALPQRPPPCPREVPQNEVGFQQGVALRSQSRMTMFFNFCEKIAKNFQLRYMAERRTTEVISDGVIRFHPQDARKWIMKEYQERLDKM